MKILRVPNQLLENNCGYFVVGICCLLLSLVLGSAGLPAPQGDESYYKSPAAELALNGRLASPCVHGFLPHARTVFACYPPLYQIVLASWYSICGFSLQSSLTFSYLVHSLNAIAVSVIAGRLLRSYSVSSVVRNVLVAAPGLIHAANLAYFDRPEELGLLWIWAELLFVERVVPNAGRWRVLASGVLIGLAALTAPWTGVLAVLVVTSRSILAIATSSDVLSWKAWRKTLLVLLVLGAVSTSMIWSWRAILDFLYPGVLDAQMAVVFRYHEQTQLGGTILEKLNTFLRTMLFNPPQLTPTAVVMLFFPVAVFSKGVRESHTTGPAIYVAALMGMLGVALVRPGAYPYFGACQILLLPCFALAMSRFVCGSLSKLGTSIGSAVVVLCVLLSFGQVKQLAVLWLNLESNGAHAVASELTEIIPAHSTVAVTPRHWHVFQNRNDWREIFFCSFTDPSEILQCEWLVLYPDAGVPSVIEHFEFVRGNTGRASQPGSYEYSVWRRRQDENGLQ